MHLRIALEILYFGKNNIRKSRIKSRVLIYFKRKSTNKSSGLYKIMEYRYLWIASYLAMTKPPHHARTLVYLPEIANT
jgi:hypothetical protein